MRDSETSVKKHILGRRNVSVLGLSGRRPVLQAEEVTFSMSCELLVLLCIFMLASHVNRHVYMSFTSARCRQFLKDTDCVLFILVYFSPEFHNSIVLNIELNNSKEVNE